MFSEVPDNARQHVCAMAKILDEGVGNITAALKSKGIYDETIQIFSSDNGGPTNHNEGTFSDNFPMRGGKNTIWEVGSKPFRNSSLPISLYCQSLVLPCQWPCTAVLYHAVPCADVALTLAR